MDKIKIKVGSLNTGDCEPFGNSLRVDDSGRILTLRVTYFPADFVAWNPNDDVYIDQYMGQDDAQIKDINQSVDLEKAVRDAVFQLNKSYAPESAEIIFQSGACGTFSIKEEKLFLHYHPVPQLEKVDQSIPYRIPEHCHQPEPDLKEIRDLDLLAQQGYQWRTERSGCYFDKPGVDGLNFVMFTLEKAGEKVLTSTAHLPLYNQESDRKDSGQLYNQTILHVDDPLGRQIIQILKEQELNR